MFDIYIPLFPGSYLSHSVITTVWIGIMVVAFFNLRFGWLFTGLIVPGYLTPLLLIKPLSVLVIFVESAITYQLIYLLSEVAGRHGLWTNFFGRDRFFALLLGSVAVRLFFDGWALPWLNHYSVSNYGINLDLEDSLHSFGLIIVALIANYLWKPKLLHGFFQLAVTVGLTYIIIRYVFIEYTNFSLSNIGYLYEDIAGSILASPKSYIILLLTAFVASRMNLFYGWDFNGILVPSLLALQWYQPMKILTSFLEAYLILLFAILILKLPIFNNISMEGARKVVLFFNVGFFYKVVLSIGIVYFIPEHKVSDYFGFGYLLSTLIAVKMYDKISMPLFVRTTLQTSLVSIVIATILGYILTQLPSTSLFYSKPQQMIPFVKSEKENIKLMSYLGKQKVFLYGKSDEVLMQKPTPSELENFKRALSLIDKGYRFHEREIYEILSSLHYKTKILQDNYLVLEQKEGYHGWGLYVIDLNTKSKMMIEVPYPLETSNIMESAAIIMKLSNAKVLAMSGVPFEIEERLASDIYNNYYSIYHLVHKHYSKDSVLQIRDLNDKLYHDLFPNKMNEDSISTLFVKGYMPRELDLVKIKTLISSLQITWDDRTGSSIQKTVTHNGFAELYLTEKDRIQLLSSKYYFDEEFKKKSSIESIEGLLNSWVLDKKLEISKKNSELYVLPSIEELLFFDNVIFTPINNILSSQYNKELDLESVKSYLYPISIAAKSVGYTLTLYNDTINHKSYIILHEEPGTKKRYWGTYVFKLGRAENITIQTPRPFYEINTFEFSLEVFIQLNAKVLLLSGTHPLTNSDGSSDILRFENKKNIFSLLSQILYRESKENSMNVLQIRGMKQDVSQQIPTAILAFHDFPEDINHLNTEERLIYDYIHKYMPVSINDGTVESAGYTSQSMQSQYLKQSFNNTFSTLWLPDTIRSQYRQIKEKDILMQQFKTLGIKVKNLSILDYISTLPGWESKGCYKDIFSHIKHYLDSLDITELESLHTRKEISLEVIVDMYNSQPYLLAYKKENRKLITIVKLNAQPPYTIDSLNEKEMNIDGVKQFYHNTSELLKMDNICEK